MQDPLTKFDHWFLEATQAGEEQPEAMALATSTIAGIPSVRMVLLKGRHDHRFQFFTNHTSNKAANLKENPHAALLFFWPKLQRQIRIEGAVTLLSAGESDAYWKTRPELSKIAAIASHQSHAITSFADLTANFEREQKKWTGKEIPRPAFWGGYSVEAASIEFWQGREHRLHERVVYLYEKGEWRVELLSP